MSDEKMVSEREAVLRERAAFERGSVWVAGVCYTGPHSLAKMAADNRTQLARKAYPLPVRRRPIRVTFSDGSVWFRIADCLDAPRFARPSDPTTGAWTVIRVSQDARTADDFRAIVRMLDGGTEEVPEGEE